MLRMYSILCKERETLMQIKCFTPENKIPAGLLSQGVDAIRNGNRLLKFPFLFYSFG